MIVDMWTTIKPYLNKKDKNDAAEAFLQTLENYVNIESMIEEIMGVDSSLDLALSSRRENTDEDNYNDENDGNYDKTESDGPSFNYDDDE